MKMLAQCLLIVSIAGGGLGCKSRPSVAALKDDETSSTSYALFPAMQLGPNLPTVGRSLFDIVTTETTASGEVVQQVPFPFERLLERLSIYSPSYEIDVSTDSESPPLGDAPNGADDVPSLPGGTDDDLPSLPGGNSPFGSGAEGDEEPSIGSPFGSGDLPKGGPNDGDPSNAGRVRVPGYIALLLPKGRSIQKHKVSAVHPRIVVAVDGAPSELTDRIAPNLSGRLFLGYAEEAEALEVISFNPKMGRYEFQVVKDYGPGKKPKVYYAPRSLCVSCHHGQAALFPSAPWSETNAGDRGNVATLDALRSAVSGRVSYHGVPLSPRPSLSRQGLAGDFDQSVKSSADFLGALALYQRLTPPETHKGAAHELGLRWACVEDFTPMDQPEYEKLVAAHARLNATLFPQPSGMGARPKFVTYPSPVLDDPMATEGELVLDPTDRRRRPQVTTLFGPEESQGAILQFLKILRNEYKPFCSILPAALRSHEAIRTAMAALVEKAKRGDVLIFQQDGFDTSGVLSSLIAASGTQPPRNLETLTEALPIKTLASNEVDTGGQPLPSSDGPSPLLFRQYCGDCHGEDGSPSFTTGSEEDIRRALMALGPKRIAERLAWEKPSNRSKMPPEDSEQRTALLQDNTRQVLLQILEDIQTDVPQ